MRQEMLKMEDERAQMVAEVEAQIERALASMGMDLVDSDIDSHYGSERSVGSRSRSISRTTSGSGIAFPKRSFSTESTLAETVVADGPYHNDSVIEEEPEEISATEGIKESYPSGDALAAVDKGIEDNSGRIAQKVQEIQQKVSSMP